MNELYCELQTVTLWKMTWDYIQIALGLLFLIGVFGLLLVLIPLAIAKKKFLIYAEQIKRQGKIDVKMSALEAQFDLFIAGYIFSDIPSIKQRPDVYEFKEIIELKDSIEFLTKIAKPLAIGFGILVVALIVLLNLLNK